MKKYNVQPRIYDGGKKFEGYPDRYSVFFPLPKKYQEETLSRVRGVYLGCSPTTEGMIRCTWDEVRKGEYIGGDVNLGRRVKLDTFPKPFQNIISRMAAIYNRALNENTDKAWEAWSLC